MGTWALNRAKGIGSVLTNVTLNKLDTGVSTRLVKPGKRCSGSYYINKHGFSDISPPVPVSKGCVPERP